MAVHEFGHAGLQRARPVLVVRNQALAGRFEEAPFVGVEEYGAVWSTRRVLLALRVRRCCGWRLGDAGPQAGAAGDGNGHEGDMTEQAAAHRRNVFVPAMGVVVSAGHDGLQKDLGRT